MADQKGQSEPIDSKLLRDLNSRATAVQDAARGIPEAMLTEYETVQRPIARALRDSGKDIRNVIEHAESVSKKSRKPTRRSARLSPFVNRHLKRLSRPL